MQGKVRVAIVDDHPMLCDGLAETLQSFPDFDLIARGATASDAIGIAEEHRPDLILMDVNMPGDGITAVKTIAEQFPDIRILMLSALDDEQHVTRALQLGASGYVVKGVSGEELIDSARRVHRGESYVSPGLAARLLSERQSAGSGPFVALGNREEQILRLLTEGMSNAEIGLRLKLSEKTIKHYMTGLMRKLGAKHRMEAALIGRQLFQSGNLQ